MKRVKCLTGYRLRCYSVSMGRKPATENRRQTGRLTRNRRRVSGTLSIEERAAARALVARGSSIASAARVLGVDTEAVSAVVRGARALLDSSASEYAALHLQAAREAASRGRAEPAQWALERLGVVESSERSSGQGVSIRVGVLLPGLVSPAGISGGVRAQALPAEVVSVHDDAQ